MNLVINNLKSFTVNHAVLITIIISLSFVFVIKISPILEFSLSSQISEICSLTKFKPYYDCSKKWFIMYNPTTDEMKPSSIIGLWSVTNGNKIRGMADPFFNVVFVTNSNMRDHCNQSVLQHELRHLKDSQWNHENCWDDELGKNIFIESTIPQKFIDELIVGKIDVIIDKSSFSIKYVIREENMDHYKGQRMINFHDECYTKLYIHYDMTYDYIDEYCKFGMLNYVLNDNDRLIIVDALQSGLQSSATVSEKKEKKD